MKGHREETRTDGRTSFLLDVMEPAGIEGIDMEELLHQSADILEHFPGCFYVCRAQEPWAVLYANRELLDFLECQDIEEWRRYIHNNTENMLVFEDRQRVLAEIRKQRLAAQGRFAHVPIRLLTRTGRIRYAELSGRCVKTTREGEVYCCLITETEHRSGGHAIDKDVRDYVIHHLDEAIEKHWIHIYYQPVICTLTGDLCGFEALARWIDPHVGFLAPFSFIPALEQAHQIHRLDVFVLNEICQMLRRRLDENLPVLPVSFNLSRLDFSLLDVFAVIEEALTRYDLPRDLLHVEVTESAMAKDPGPIRQTMDRLRAAGYEVWLDDFGSGYSSLNILKDCTVDLIKLDMGFLRNFTEKSRQIIASTIDMAKRLGIKTLTEGVETKEQADFLASIGCGRLQGYYFGKPQPLVGAFAHNEAQGRGLELRKWHHYYDVASASIYQTPHAMTLLEFADGKVHHLYTNEAYLEEVRNLHYTLEQVEASVNDPHDPTMYAIFRDTVQLARQSHQRETCFYVVAGSYIRVELRVVLEYAGRVLIFAEIKNITQERDRLTHNRFDKNLRFLYTLFDNIMLVHLDDDWLEPLFIQEPSEAERQHQKNEGITKMLVHYAQELIHPDDRSRYLAYCDPKTVLARLMAQPHSRLFDCFRVRDRHGNYSWKEFTATLLPNSGKHAFLTTVQELNLRPHTLETLLQETGEPSVLPISDELAALLWKNLQHSSQLCYFWKDRQRRFVGASRAFLDYHGFASEQAILGKTDEEMGWHVDNEPYRNDELAVLEKGHVVNNAPGHCIIHGTIHHITCYKWPIYQDGQIIGLMGTFFDVDNILRKNLEDAKITYQDMLTGLMNRQGLLDALMRYEEQWQLHHRPYSLILLDGRSYQRLADTYGEKTLQKLIQKQADVLCRLAGKDAVLARVTQAVFALVRYTDKRDVETQAQELAQALEDIHEIDGNPVTVTMQYAIVQSDEPGISSETIYKAAMDRLQRTPPKKKIENGYQ